MSLLSKLVAGSEWSQWLDFATPSFFSVVPTFAMLSEARALMQSSQDKSACEAIAQGVSGVSSRFEDSGELALRLYFHQLLHGERTALDIRRSAFSLPKDKGQPGLQWNPAALSVQWNETFLKGLRDLYIGFYTEDRATFRLSLEELELGPAEEALRNHLGAGDQSQVPFTMKTFREGFHNVFLACKENGLTLHPQFLQLGCYLAFLYSHLEELGEKRNVRKAFFDVLEGDWQKKLEK